MLWKVTWKPDTIFEIDILIEMKLKCKVASVVSSLQYPNVKKIIRFNFQELEVSSSKIEVKGRNIDGPPICILSSSASASRHFSLIYSTIKIICFLFNVIQR